MEKSTSGNSESTGVLLMEELDRKGVSYFDYLGFHHQFDFPEFKNGRGIAGFKILEKRKILTEKFESFLCMRIGYTR